MDGWWKKVHEGTRDNVRKHRGLGFLVKLNVIKHEDHKFDSCHIKWGKWGAAKASSMLLLTCTYPMPMQKCGIYFRHSCKREIYKIKWQGLGEGKELLGDVCFPLEKTRCVREGL